MKKYKVDYYKGADFILSKYFDDTTSAKQCIKDYNNKYASRGFKAIDCGKVEMKYHHDAIAKGYCGVKNQHEDYYDGRFGVGYIVHYPTLDKSRIHAFRGNSWHIIEYYVEC